MKRCSYLFFLIISFSIISFHAAAQAKKDSIKKHVRLIEISPYGDLPKPNGYVNDFEKIFSAKEKSILESLVSDFQKKTGIPIAVISFSTKMTEADSLDATTMKFANAWAWGVGEKGANNGVVIGLSKAYHRMRILNGLAIQPILSETETNQIIGTSFIPGYRSGNYFQGTYNGLRSLMAILEKRYKN